MKRLIFGTYEFFGSGHFLINFQYVRVQKMAGSKKDVKVKNQIFHARQPREEIFEIR